MSEFVAHLEEVFERFAPIRARRMFGGHGLYREDVMFALVADDVLYLKCDDAMATALRELGSLPFTYEKQGKTVRLGSYFTAPEAIFDDPDAAAEWADRAYEAALRSRLARFSS